VSQDQSPLASQPDYIDLPDLVFSNVDQFPGCRRIAILTLAVNSNAALEPGNGNGDGVSISYLHLI